MAGQLTVRNVPKELARRLAKLAEATGRSVNATVLELLERATGLDARRARLERYTTWSKEDVDDFEQSLRAQRTIDRELWESMHIVLDTSAYSHFRGNHAKVVDRIATADLVYLPMIVLGELEAAFRLGRRMADNRAKLEEFMHEDFVRVLPVTPEVARRYGEIFVELRASGTPIPVNDIWIAATTIDAGAELVTFDSDFDRVARLERTILVP